MEAVEFIRTIQKMCTKRHCDDCPLSENYRCNVCYTDDPVKTVQIVEEWAAEHLEIPDKERQKQGRMTLNECIHTHWLAEVEE